MANARAGNLRGRLFIWYKMKNYLVVAIHPNRIS